MRVESEEVLPRLVAAGRGACLLGRFMCYIRGKCCDLVQGFRD